MTPTAWVVLIGWPTASILTGLILGRYLQTCEEGTP